MPGIYAEIDVADLGIGHGIDARKRGERKEDAVIREFMHEVAAEGEIALIKYVPYGNTGYLIDSIEQGRVNKLAGGNIYSVEVSVTAHYAEWVDEGTGDKTGEKGLRSGKDNIIRAEHGNVMAFEKDTGETVFTRYIHGQKPSDFSGKAQRAIDDYIEVNKHRLAEEVADAYFADI